MATLIFVLLLGNTPQLRFTEQGTGTNVFLDQITGLKFFGLIATNGGACPNGKCAYATATTACGAIASDGGGWRLPSVHELLNILDPRSPNDYGLGGQAIRGTGPNETDATYWTNNAIAPGYHLTVRFQMNANVAPIGRREDNQSAYVRCVK